MLNLTNEREGFMLSFLIDMEFEYGVMVRIIGNELNKQFKS